MTVESKRNFASWRRAVRGARHAPRPLTLASVALMLVTTGALQPLRAQDEADGNTVKFSAEAAAVFNRRCTACHTYGKGIKVGPDLKGVTERRKRDWLVKFIHASSNVIKAGDPTATSLFAQFKQQRMPDWTDLSDKQINEILDYLVVGGPNIKPADERNAELAAPAEVEQGRRLFSGLAPLKYGARACSACHYVRGAGFGGTLGPDLTTVYFRYQDRALTEFLRHPCFRWSTGGPATPYLTLRESFSLKAFLRQAALQKTARTAGPEQKSGATQADASGGQPAQSSLQAHDRGKPR
jgi:mono/diheme cytochrome c family protein